MPEYDASRYNPPAPVARVTLRDLTGGTTVSDVELLIDTGADVTLLPADAVRQLGVMPEANRQYELVAFDGSRSFADVVELDLLFLNKAFRGPYLLTNDVLGVLGGDVLASLKLVFDGPQQSWNPVA